MINCYLSVCISGLQQPAARLLREELPLAEDPVVDDGLVIYRTHATAAAVQKLKFFNNSFLLIKDFPSLPAKQDPFTYMLQATTRLRLNQDQIAHAIQGQHRFRLVLSDENKLVSADRSLVSALENKLAGLQNLQLQIDLHRPQLEFWLMRRRDQTGYFLLRLTRNTTSRKMQPGSLRPELAYLMCYLSEPEAADVFLDPFAGSGSIPLARLDMAPAELVFMSDIAPERIQSFRRTRKGDRAQKIIPKHQDALKLDFFEDQFLDKIVTDPPWGIYESVPDLEAFYQAMLQSFDRVLKPGGRLVLLTAGKNEFSAALGKYRDRLCLKEQYDILVSGKKAAVYVIDKLKPCQGDS